MLSLLLFQEIAQMFVALILGYVIVRCGILKSGDSKVLSILAMYIIFPCVIINSFQIEFTTERLHGMFLALGAVILTHLLFYLLTLICRKPLRLNSVEQASLIYANAANLTIPIVSSLLGAEWVFYVSIYVMFQQFLLWSHCRLLISGERNIPFKKILLNVNVLSALAGAALFFFRVPLPGILRASMASISAMIGPLTMMVAGMLMGNVNFRTLFQSFGLWKVALLRLVVYPLILVLLMKYSGLATLVPNGETILLVSLLSSITPSSATITQQAQVYGSDSQHASLINVITMLLCIVTIPIMIGIYQM